MFHSTQHWRQLGYFGDSVAVVAVRFYADADFAGVSHSTHDAEIMAADVAIRHEGSPYLAWDALAPAKARVCLTKRTRP